MLKTSHFYEQSSFMILFVLHSLTMSLTASATKLVTPSVSKSDVYIFLLLIFIDFLIAIYFPIQKQF